MKPGSLTSIQTIPPSTFQFQNSSLIRLLAARTDLQHPNHFSLHFKSSPSHGDEDSSFRGITGPRLPHDFLFLPSTRIDSNDSPLSLSPPVVAVYLVLPGKGRKYPASKASTSKSPPRRAILFVIDGRFASRITRIGDLRVAPRHT